MRVIICGAGQVGFSIASYLSREDNDVTVIDTQADMIARVNETLDANGIVGHASNPDVLDLAGASDADLIIAVTHSDEINMVACQVAHSLFNVPKKIARIRSQSYLNPAWLNLFSRNHLPIDVIISPEREIAEAIYDRLKVPGTTNVIGLAEDKVHMAGVICGENCPIVNTPLRQIVNLFPNLTLQVGAIIRNNRPVFPGPDDQMLVGDEVYFFTDTKHLKRALAAFGHEEQEARNVTVLGGGNIGLYLTRLLHKEHSQVRIKVIESDLARAIKLSESLPGISVLHGNGLDTKMLESADIASTEAMVTVTNNDETNIIASLLSKRLGCGRTISLVNNTGFLTLINMMEIDALVSPRAITVSSIMQHIRRGRIKALHSLREGFAEVIEAEVSETSGIANQAIGSIRLPKDVIFGAVVRGDEVIMPRHDLIIRPGDHVIILSAQEQARKVEKIFLVHVDLF